MKSETLNEASPQSDCCPYVPFKHSDGTPGLAEKQTNDKDSDLSSTQQYLFQVFL